MSKSTLAVALAGNPNSGKTTIFNAITGGRQHVANYAGVTVEKKEGRATHDGVDLNVVDLPGTYSLTAYSIEEIVARNFILEEDPDVVVDIIDSSNLERNLYLATQILELGVPLVLAFNMSDVAKARGLSIDDNELSELLGVPIVHTVAHKGKGVEQLLAAVVEVARNRDQAVARQRHPDYGHEIEPHVVGLTNLIAEKTAIKKHQRWFALKLLENDEETIKRLRKLCPGHIDEITGKADHLRDHIERVCGDSAEIVLADRRYGFISGACTESVTNTVEARHAHSDKIDAVLTNRWLGLPIFAVLMYLTFQLTFAVGNPMVEWLDVRKGELAEAVKSLAAGRDSLVLNLLADGVINGVGAVLVFVPLILLLFLAISFLEDSGYMARGAFILDRLMHKIGLHGKSFIPMLIGFGCTVPAIMATRTLESRRDRLTTIMVLPLMSCGARLPVYALILAALFPKRYVFATLGITNQGLLLWLIYMIGIVLAIVGIKVFRATLFKGEATPFVMELPPYRMPTLRGLLIHMWERTWMYVKKAGTIILPIVVILWALSNWPGLGEADIAAFAEQRQAVQADANLIEADRVAAIAGIDNMGARAALEHSAIGRVGRAIAPVLRPCGFDWKTSTAMIGAFAAKEAFVGQMGVIYAVGEDAGAASGSLRARLAADYSQFQGFCLMLFLLIASPCMATVAVTVRESGSWKWAAFQWGYLTALAWAVTTVVYQVGSAIGH